MCCTKPSALLDLCQWEFDQCHGGKRHHPSGDLPVAVCAFSELNTDQQRMEAFAKVLLSPLSLHNLPGTMMVHKLYCSLVPRLSPLRRGRTWEQGYSIVCSSKHDTPATWKLLQKMNPARVNSTYTTNYPMQYSWDLRTMLGSRKDPEFSYYWKRSNNAEGMTSCMHIDRGGYVLFSIKLMMMYGMMYAAFTRHLTWPF